MSRCLTEQEILEICMSKVDYRKLTAKTHTLCIDGTSCTMKSSILQATGYMTTKIQQNHRIQNPNTFGPSMIGYISAGINDNLGTRPHFNDRSPLNVMDWHILWKFMDDYVTRFGNVEPNEENPEMFAALETYRNGFRAYKAKCTTKLMASFINAIALVDTNTMRCDEMRFKRNKTETDVIRSPWKFYTYLQNLMYLELYENLHIDMAWFHDTDADTIIESLAKFFVFVLEYMSKNLNSSHRPCTSLSLPTVRHDYNLSNAKIHVYRSIGRWGCRILTGEEEHLRTRLPKYLDVSNVKYPNGLTHEPIIPATRKYIFLSDGNSVAAGGGGGGDGCDDAAADAYDDDDEYYDEVAFKNNNYVGDATTATATTTTNTTSGNKTYDGYENATVEEMFDFNGNSNDVAMANPING